MRSKIIFLLLFAGPLLSAQNFTDHPQLPPFDSVAFSSIAVADVNGDSHLDVLISGENMFGALITKLYTNDGSGVFTEQGGNLFPGIKDGSKAFADVDGDTDMDLFISGNSGVTLISKLYINDGSGNFSEHPSSSFPGIFYSSVAFADVDGDTDQDLAISGNAGAGLITQLYINDGSGNFSASLVPLKGVDFSSIAFADVDGDTDQDLLVAGFTGSGQTSTLYLNDGTGSFSESGNTIDGVEDGSVAFADVDGDTDQDLFITGFSQFASIAKLYINDGMGNFSEDNNSTFEGVDVSSIALTDVESDNDYDLLITGRTNSFIPSTTLYTNDGTGTFSEYPDHPFEDVEFGSIAFLDLETDSDYDVIIKGRDSLISPSTNLFLNLTVISSTEDIANALNFNFTLFPNPTKAERLNVSLNSEEWGSLNIRILDLNGRLLSQQKRSTEIGQQAFSLDIASLTPGTYLIQLDNGKKSGVRKFVIQ